MLHSCLCKTSSPYSDTYSGGRTTRYYDSLPSEYPYKSLYSAKYDIQNSKEFSQYPYFDSSLYQTKYVNEYADLYYKQQQSQYNLNSLDFGIKSYSGLLGLSGLASYNGMCGCKPDPCCSYKSHYSDMCACDQCDPCSKYKNSCDPCDPCSKYTNKYSRSYLY